MTLVNTETGEIVEPLTELDAERLTKRIGLRLDTIADNYSAVVPMIREAVERNAWSALGYRSPGEYAADRFGDALSHLGPEFREAVVGELAGLGMSTRAIAPIVGVSRETVRQIVSGDKYLSPEPQTSTSAPLGGGADVAEPSTPEDVPPPIPARPPVTGLDGKTYTRPVPVDHAAKADAAVADFPDLAHYRDLGDLEHTWRLADMLREHAAKGDLAERLDILRRSIAVDRSKRDGTYRPPTPVPEQTCPTCGQTVRG